MTLTVEQAEAEFYAELARLQTANEPPRFRVMSAKEFLVDDPIPDDLSQSAVVEHIYRPSDLIDADTFADEPEETPNDQIAGVIPTTGTGQLFAPSGSGKSFTALKIAADIALGREFHTGRVTRQGGAVYVCAEGARGFKRRLRALRKHYGVESFGGRLKILRVPVNLFKPTEAGALTARIKESLPEATCVIFDTRWRCSLGAKEDSADDNAIIFGSADHIARELNAFCLLIAHTGYDETRVRGSSAQFAACDVELQVKRTGDVMTLCCTKAKDSDDSTELNFKTIKIDLGRNSHGEPESSLVLEPMAAAEAAAQFQPNGKIEKAAHDYVLKSGGTRFSKEALVTEVAKASGSRASTVRRAVERQLVGRLFLADGDELELRPGIIADDDGWMTGGE